MSVLAPLEAHARVAAGAVLVDVRAHEEFIDGHPAGATNVPLAHFVEGRLVDDVAFVEAVRTRFSADSRLVLLCRSGVRAARAAALLMAADYTDVHVVAGGYEGTRGPFGEVVERGWRRHGLP